MDRGNTKRCQYTYQTTRNKRHTIGCKLGDLCPLKYVERTFCSRRRRHEKNSSDSPEELGSKKILHRASSLKLIEKAEKDRSNVAVWKIR